MRTGTITGTVGTITVTVGRTTTTTEVTELLHAGALGASALGACCVALDGPRPRIRELLLMAVMVLAMADVLTGAGVVPTVWWSALTVAAALALAVRRRTRPEPAPVARMRVHSAVGAVLMASAMLLMSSHATGAPASHHGPSPALLLGALIAATAVFVLSAVAAARTAHRLDRVQYAAMSGSLVALCAAALL